MRELFNLSLDSRTACREFLAVRSRTPLVRLPNRRHPHWACFAPSGAGKNQGLIYPFLANHPGGLVCIDPKGEAALLFAELRRRRFGHRVIVVDPYQCVTQRPDALNVLDCIDRDDPLALDYCDELAEALVMYDPNDHNRHFADAAKKFISAVIATTVYYGNAGASRSLQTVSSILSSPPHLAQATEVMCESDAYDGLLARRGSELLHFQGKELGSVLTTAGRHLAFLNTPAVAASTAASTFDPREIGSGGFDAFLVLPPQFLASKNALLRLWITAFMRAVIQGGLQEDRLTTFIFDEASALGPRFPLLQEALSRYRSYGARLFLIYQCVSQLKQAFPDSDGEELLSNAVQIYFGANTHETCEAISARLGDSTIVVRSGSGSVGYSTQSSAPAMSAPSQSRTYSTNDADNWAPHGRRLLTAAEVATLPRDLAITFVSGLPPILTRLVPYHLNPRLGQRTAALRRWITASATLTQSFVYCVLALALALVMGLLLHREGPASFGRLLDDSYGRPRANVLSPAQETFHVPESPTTVSEHPERPLSVWPRGRR